MVTSILLYLYMFAKVNPNSSHHLKLRILPSTSYMPTFLRTSSPTSGGLWPLGDLSVKFCAIWFPEMFWYS